MLSPKSKPKKTVLVLLAVALAGAAIQLIRPNFENPPVTKDIGAPAAVEDILRKDCYDCHSNETKLRWFDQLTPANFLVAGDISAGRAVLNFSHWDRLDPAQQAGKIFEAINQAGYAVMPPSRYFRFHPTAAVSDSDLDLLRDYATTLAPAMRQDSANTTKASAALSQWAHWLAEGQAPNGAGSAGQNLPNPTAPVGPLPALNGVSFRSDFSNWAVLGTTDRWDNGTERMILGNDKAVDALKQQHTNPWPDGACFAKAAWTQVIDSAGTIHPGAFLQVECMIKDSAKYATTGGWGFARWVKGTDLVPYGGKKSFTTECMNCHQPMQNNDLVFTIPHEPHQGRLISSMVDRRQKLLLVLYGNDIASNNARTGPAQLDPPGPAAPHAPAAPHTYPTGSVLWLVTSTLQDDPNWFGANMPGAVQSVETVSVLADPNGSLQPFYELKLGGHQLAPDSPLIKSRVRLILNMSPILLP
jgi:hypothetical protein